MTTSYMLDTITEVISKSSSRIQMDLDEAMKPESFQPGTSKDSQSDLFTLFLPYNFFGISAKSNTAESTIANWKISAKKQLCDSPGSDDCLLVRLYCERKKANVVYHINYKLSIIASTTATLGVVEFEPLDQCRSLLRMDWSYFVDSYMLVKKSDESEIKVDYNLRLSNCVLEINGKLIFVDKDLLSECSPVFRAMFTSSFAETNQEKIKVEGVEYEEMLEMLDHIYQPVPHNFDEQVEYCQHYGNQHITKTPTHDPTDYGQITESNVECLLKLADYYDLEELSLKCENWMLEYDNTEYSDPQLLVKRLYLAEKYRIEFLMEMCLKQVDTSVLKELKTYETYDLLSLEFANQLDEKVKNDDEELTQNIKKRIRESDENSVFKK
uniref:BTB domain-containing protein n=1 Tax=Ditylenchus dipsaci TaxID=166011 RepID=A0A915E4U3_9BILA